MKYLFPSSVLFLIVSLIGIVLHAEQAREAYFLSFTFFLQFSLGALAIDFLHTLTGGKWGIEIKTQLYALKKTIRYAPLLILPLLFSLNDLYHWTNLDQSVMDEVLRFKHPFYSPFFFSIRAFIYLGIFLYLQKIKKNALPSAIGMICFFVTMSIVVIDWYMGMEPHWQSTIYALIIITGQVCTSFCSVLIMSHSKKESITSDLGTLLFVFLLTWAYVFFMQYLIIWSGNLPEEVSWYLKRTENGWRALLLLIVPGLIIIPFFFLLNRTFKSHKKNLTWLAAFLLLIRYCETAWLVLPPLRPQFYISLWDMSCLLGIGGLTLWSYRKNIEGADHET